MIKKKRVCVIVGKEREGRQTPRLRTIRRSREIEVIERNISIDYQN